MSQVHLPCPPPGSADEESIAAAFYHVLTLASKNLMLVLGQDEPYGEVGCLLGDTEHF
jgi:hypothetical protein